MRNLCFSVTFVTNEARDYHRMSSEIRSFCHENPNERFHFFTFGRFDQMILSFSDDAGGLLASDSKIHRSLYAENHVSYFGHILKSRLGASKIENTLSSSSLCIFATIRFSPKIRRFFLTREHERSAIQEIGQRLEKTKVKFFISKTLGWDDLGIFIFSNNFADIVKAMGAIRGIRVEDILGHDDAKSLSVKHALVTTCVIPSIWMDACDDMLRKTRLGDKYSDIKLSGVDFSDDTDQSKWMSWSVRIESRPGHWEGLIKEIRKFLKPDFNVKDEIIFGQSDYRLSVQDGPIKDFLYLSTCKFIELIGRNDTPVCSIDTHIHLKSDQYEEDSSADCWLASYETLAPDPKAWNDTIDDIKSEGVLPEHTIQSVRSLASKIHRFKRHYLLEAEFKHLQVAFECFINGLLNELSVYEDNQYSIDGFVSDWMYYFEKAIANRFEGVYPTGENILLRLGSFHATYYKFINLIDELICLSTDLLWTKLPDEHRPQRSSYSAVSFLGASPNAYCITSLIAKFGSGFIDIPVDLMMHRKDLTIVTHEIGHYLKASYFHANEVLLEKHIPDLVKHNVYDYVEDFFGPIIDGIDGEQLELSINKLNYFIEEIIADLFAFCLCYPDDIESHYISIKTIVERIFPQPESARKYKINSFFRLHSSHSLYKYIIQQDTEDYAPFCACKRFSGGGVFSEKIHNLIASSEAVDNDNYVYDFCGWLIAIAVLEMNYKNNVDFSSFLDAIVSIRSSKSFHDKISDQGALKEFRMMLAQPTNIKFYQKLKSIDNVSKSVHAAYNDICLAKEA